MGNSSVPINEKPYLTVYFGRKFGEISGEFRCYYFAMYFSPIDPFKGIEVAGLEP
jgi:hypothetical protein